MGQLSSRSVRVAGISRVVVQLTLGALAVAVLLGTALAISMISDCAPACRPGWHPNHGQLATVVVKGVGLAALFLFAAWTLQPAPRGGDSAGRLGALRNDLALAALSAAVLIVLAAVARVDTGRPPAVIAYAACAVILIGVSGNLSARWGATRGASARLWLALVAWGAAWGVLAPHLARIQPGRAMLLGAVLAPPFAWWLAKSGTSHSGLGRR